MFSEIELEIGKKSTEFNKHILNIN